MSMNELRRFVALSLAGMCALLGAKQNADEVAVAAAPTAAVFADYATPAPAIDYCSNRNDSVTFVTTNDAEYPVFVDGSYEPFQESSDPPKMPSRTSLLTDAVTEELEGCPPEGCPVEGCPVGEDCSNCASCSTATAGCDSCSTGPAVKHHRRVGTGRILHWVRHREHRPLKLLGRMIKGRVERATARRGRILGRIRGCRGC